MAETAYPFSCTSRRWLLGHRHASSSDHEGLRAVRLYPGRCARGEPPSLPSTRTIWQRAPVSVSPIQASGAKPASYLSASMRQRGTASTVSPLWMECGLFILFRDFWWLSGKESACQCRRHGFDSWSRKIPEQLSPCATTTEPVL